MNASPLVSVCMTTFNHAPYIARSIERALSQRTTFAVELVVSYECSADGTGRSAATMRRVTPTGSGW